MLTSHDFTAITSHDLLTTFAAQVVLRKAIKEEARRNSSFVTSTGAKCCSLKVWESAFVKASTETTGSTGTEKEATTAAFSRALEPWMVIDHQPIATIAIYIPILCVHEP